MGGEQSPAVSGAKARLEGLVVVSLQREPAPSRLQITVERTSVADEDKISCQAVFTLSQSSTNIVERQLSFVSLISWGKHADSYAGIDHELIQPFIDQCRKHAVYSMTHRAIRL